MEAEEEALRLTESVEQGLAEAKRRRLASSNLNQSDSETVRQTSDTKVEQENQI